MNITGISAIAVGVALILLTFGKFSFGASAEDYQKHIAPKKHRFLFIGLVLIILGVAQQFIRFSN